MPRTPPDARATPAQRDAEALPAASLSALRPLVPFALRYKGRIAAGLVALVVASAATLAVPTAVRRMIDFGFSPEGSGLIRAYFGAMLAVVAVLALASAARFYFVMTLGERVVADLRDAVFRHLATLDAGFYDSARTGELVSRLTADATQIRLVFGASASVALRNLFMFVGATAMMIVTSPKLSAVALVVIPVIVLPLFGAGRSVRARARRAQDRLADATAFAAEAIGAVRTVQAYGAERFTADRYGVAVEAAYASARDAAKARALLTAFAMFFAFGSVVGVLWLGATDVLAGRMTGGTLSQFVLYAVLGAGALGALSEVWSEISAAAGSAGRIAELLATRPAIVAPAAPAVLPSPARGDIAFEGVEFTYPTRPDAPALHGLSFRVRPGETVAIVGPSGAGKSTVFQLLMRFYDPVVGRVRLDGVDLRDADPAAVRARIALVSQDPVIFGASVGDNIRQGRRDATEAQVVQAAVRAAADPFVRALPNGYATTVGERGATLSGGQRQRLAIARAILKDAPILLLDEATSALDAENETLVQAALDDLMRDRTTLVIAHRLATVLSADRILVLDGGRLVEEGTHASLIQQRGLYERLARLQFETGAAGLKPAQAAE